MRHWLLLAATGAVAYVLWDWREIIVIAVLYLKGLLLI